MANKIYRTASGRELDMQKLMLQNEEVRAVGNMNVNARGDVLDSDNKSVSNRNKQVNKIYRKQIGNVARDIPVVNSKKAAKIIAEKNVPVDDILKEIDAPKIEPVETPVEDAPSGGLAAAIAKAREVKQEQKPSPREEERSNDGVKKI